MKEIDYLLIRSKKRKKTLMLKIERDGRVVMRVPYRTPEHEIDRFFKEKLPWVKKKINEKQEVTGGEENQKKYIAGEKFLYLGEHYPLEFREPGSGRIRLALSHGIFYLDHDCLPRARDFFVKWYKERALEIFTERVNYYSKQLKLYPKEIRISSAKRRYGSCSMANMLSFTFRLVMAPYPMIDYVIVHELVHIKVKNHSRHFWEYMEKVMPDYRKYKKWLKEHSPSLDI